MAQFAWPEKDCHSTVKDALGSMQWDVGPIFRGAQEVSAVVYELPPTVPRDVIGRTIRVEARDPPDPIDWDGTATFSRGSQVGFERAFALSC